MGLLKSLKGKGPEYIGGETHSQPSNSYDEYQTSAEKKHVFGPSSTAEEHEEYAPPACPPPSQASHKHDEFAPPPGPPPNRIPSENPPPYHDWTSVPDTALLPPPPTLHHKYSPASNASRTKADRAHKWCDLNPLFTPTSPNPAIYNNVRVGDILLGKPAEYVGDLRQKSRGVWRGKTREHCEDCIVLSSLPLYFAAVDTPLRTESTKTIYFELKVLSLGRSGSDAGIAIGFCAKPYPTWRLPGWERASLGVHSDDGRRYVNDTWGGKDFTAPWKPGETVGIEMTFRVPTRGFEGQGMPKAHVEVFFTKDGKKQGGWSIEEEQDADSEGVDGLQGELDLYAAIGMFGSVEFEAFFGPEKWQFQPGK